MFRTIRRELGVVLVVGILVSAAGVRPSAQSAPARQQETLREAWQKVPDIFAALGIGPGASVADVGAGDGFLTVRLARAVGPDGHVIAVDVSDEALARLRARVEQDALTNVAVVKGDPDDPHLAPASLDGAVIVNAYHEMVEHQAMLRRLHAALKPTGRLVIVEPITEKLLRDTRERQVSKHEIAARFVEQEARDAGFRIQSLRDPFATNTYVTEWLIVAVPEPEITTHDANAPPSVDEVPLSSPDLRMAFEAFKKRRADGSIAVVDVRSDEEYAAGHIPGALSIPLPDLRSHIEQLRALRKPIVTYCS